MRLVFGLVLESLLQSALRRVSVPWPVFLTGVFLLAMGLLFLLLALVTLVAAVTPFVVLLAAGSAAFGAVNAAAGAGVLLSKRWARRLGLVAAVVGFAWLSIGSILSAASGDLGSLLTGAGAMAGYALAALVLVRMGRLYY
jgi:hypothetical protein